MLTRDQAIARGLAAKSMLDAPQLGWLYDLARQAPDGLAVEAGVAAGGSFVCWAAAREGRGPLAAVDTWYADPAQGRGPDARRAPFLANLARFSDLRHAQMLEMPSWEAPALLGPVVAFAFIDADHSFVAAVRDVAAWPPVVLPGGILVWHDYDVWKPTVGVKAAVDRWQRDADWEVLPFIVDGRVRPGIIAFRRPAP